MRRLYLDMDGVLADFDQGYQNEFGLKASKEFDSVDWALVRGRPGFYANLPPMPDLEDLWSFTEPLRPVVLTGVPDSVQGVYDQKRAWVLKHLGPGVPVIGCRSRDKSLHMQPGDIIIDDWEKYSHLWKARGGVWITHRSAAESLQALAQWLPLDAALARTS